MHRLPNIHPGEILLEEFLQPLDIDSNALAQAIHVAPGRIEEIIRQTGTVNADMALRLARYFGTSERFWIGLQTDFDLEQASLAAKADIASIHPLAA